MRLLPALTTLLVFAVVGLMPGGVQGQSGSRTFPETGKTVSGGFLRYWNEHGGLTQQGFPISEEMREVSETDGKTYTVQYFERAVFEAHPENTPPNDVLLSLLGNFLYKQKYRSGTPAQTPNTSAGSRRFNETGKRLGGIFLAYWQMHGALPQQGFPISDEFTEKSDLDGKTYRVQYFERAVFEYHPENKPPYDVLLSQLGTFRYRDKYQRPAPTTAAATPTGRTAPTVAPTAPPAPSATRDPSVQRVDVQLIEWGIVPAEISVQSGRVRFVVTNNSRNEHNFTIASDAGVNVAGTSSFSSSQSPQTLEVTLPPGTYKTYCTLPGHERSGQRGTLLVR
jgi:hypothetical protein